MFEWLEKQKLSAIDTMCANITIAYRWGGGGWFYRGTNLELSEKFGFVLDLNGPRSELLGKAAERLSTKQ